MPFEAAIEDQRRLPGSHIAHVKALELGLLAATPTNGAVKAIFDVARHVADAVRIVLEALEVPATMVEPRARRAHATAAESAALAGAAAPPLQLAD